MGANGDAVVAAGADGLPEAGVVAGLVPDEDEDEELPLVPQPVAVKPTRAANTAARATHLPIQATSAIPPMLAMIVAGGGVPGARIGHPGGPVARGRHLADDSARPRYERTIFRWRASRRPSRRSVARGGGAIAVRA
jgi:hypothetical protein